MAKAARSLSSLFVPLSRHAPGSASTLSHALLTQAGYIRPAPRVQGSHSLLPLATATLDNTSAAIAAAMDSLPASRMSMPLLISSSLWVQSGRLDPPPAPHPDEVFALSDRADKSLLLAPTHEELFTALVAAEVDSYKALPLRLYQIGTKYRDERRPRFGLMRAREFIMKDMYSFDATPEAAAQTYADVCDAYSALFHSIGVPAVKASADSGTIGGDLSHEFHIEADVGEDALLSCDAPSCDYSANVERAPLVAAPHAPFPDATRQAVVDAVPHDPTAPPTRYSVAIPPGYALSPTRLARALDGAHAASYAPAPRPGNDTLEVSQQALAPLEPLLAEHGLHWHDIAAARPNDPCPACLSGSLTPRRGIEVAHAFHLGTKYSAPLDANVAIPTEAGSGLTKRSPIQMGCFGIGVSRLIAAVQERHADPKGLRWPLPLAPYKAIVISPPPRKIAQDPDMPARIAAASAAAVDAWPASVLHDDRDLSIGAKLRDADLMGIPVALVVPPNADNSAQVRVRSIAPGGAHIDLHDKNVTFDMALQTAVHLTNGL